MGAGGADPDEMPRWAELVFHVLAHVRATAALAPSLFDPAWIDRVQRVSGPASSRALGEDAEVLGRAVVTHDALARVQLLAWLFEDTSRASACVDRTLAELGPTDVDDPSILPLLTRPTIGAAAEILRAAAELEAEVYAALPAPAVEPHEAIAAARALADVAPLLAHASIEVVRPLGLRGRVLGSRIWIGAPDEGGPSIEHVAWQAAHEATVAELSELASTHGVSRAHDPLEHAALVLLSERARRARLEAAHARWLGHLRVVLDLARDGLPAAWRSLVEVAPRSCARA